MVRRREAIRAVWVGAVVLLMAGVWLFRRGGSSPPEQEPSDHESDASDPPKRPERREAPRRPNPVTRPRVAPSASNAQVEEECATYAATACYAGNVHWFDSCGHVQDLEQECEGLCSGGQCVAKDWTAKCTEPPEGRCEGQRLVYCDLGKTVTTDCAARGKECRRGEEGMGCFAPAANGGCVDALPRCDGESLVRCVAGETMETDCSEYGGSCLQDTQQGARCTRPLPQMSGDPDTLAECGRCGCEDTGDADSESEEECNTLDDDNNGYLDDGIACGPVTIDVLVGSGVHGEQLVDRTQLQAEIEYTNQLFADSGSEIEFTLGELDELQLAGNESLDVEQLYPLLESPSGPQSVGDLRVLLVVANRLTEGEVPKLGMAMPFVTDSCGGVLQPGGVRFDRALVAVAARRVPSTLAHELGHWLGLCHTHEQNRPASIPVPSKPGADEASADGEQAPETCGEACAYGGDAICDTPDDNEACSYKRQTCQALCPSGQQPDTSNIMSYYHACRRSFSADQVKLMEHTLALRRAWFECRDGSCECQPGLGQCPDGMSCGSRRSRDGKLGCGMDGPKLPGAPCRGQHECSAHSLCLRVGSAAHCARTCTEATPDCTCLPLSDHEFSVCREDVTESVH